MIVLLCFFFFQAEDGIRDGTVTGVQTCALPISLGKRRHLFSAVAQHAQEAFFSYACWKRDPSAVCSVARQTVANVCGVAALLGRAELHCLIRPGVQRKLMDGGRVIRTYIKHSGSRIGGGAPPVRAAIFSRDPDLVPVFGLGREDTYVPCV